MRLAIGAFAALDVIHLASGSPKARSGKIRWRILRKAAAYEDEGWGDLMTHAGLNVVSVLISEPKSKPKAQEVPLALSPNLSTRICALWVQIIPGCASF